MRFECPTLEEMKLAGVSLDVKMNLFVDLELMNRTETHPME